MTIRNFIIAALLVSSAGLAWRLDRVKTELSSLRAAGLAQEQINRAKTRIYAEKAERLTNDRKAIQIVHARVADALRSDADGLREQIAGYASQASGDTCAASIERATTLGELLADSVQLQAELAGAAENHLADARTLQEWASGLSCR